MGWITRIVVVSLLGLAGTLVANMMLAPSLQPSLIRHPGRSPDLSGPGVSIDDAVERLRKGLVIPTISYENRSKIAYQTFLDLHATLEETFPRVHNTFERTVVANYSLLYTWTGTEPALEPYVLAAHLDVVPVAEPGMWDVQPFAAKIVDGFIYARGAMDDKMSVFAIMEALEALIDGGSFAPRRTILLAFGHDEEIMGTEGARVISEVIKERHGSVAFVLDEGGPISLGLFPGLPADQPLALISTGEKGFQTIKLEVVMPGGHSSMPSRESAIGVLARALVKLEDNPVPGRLSGLVTEMLEAVCPEASFPFNLIFCNLWFFHPVVGFAFGLKPTLNASYRTTTALTVINAGEKQNTIATTAEAYVNFRILHGDTAEGTLQYVVDTINDDRVQASYDYANEPSPITPTDSEVFRLVASSVKATFGEETLVAPFLMVGGTDTKHYAPVTPNLIRFAPQLMSKATKDQKRFHGQNERLSIDNYARIIDFYYDFVVEANLAAGL